MGLLDVLNGMQQGPRGPSEPSSQSSGGMSPLTMALLGLLAWKAFRHLTGDPSGTAPKPEPGPAASPSTPSDGGLGDLLKGGLGGLLAGGAAGGLISAGLGDLVRQLEQSGQGETANSWVGKGPNKPISPGDLASALGTDQIDQLSQRSGLSRDELLSGLSRHLPQVVDHLTPEGRLPTEHDLSGRI